MSSGPYLPSAPVTARQFALRHQFRIIRDTTLAAEMQAAILRQCPGVSINELEDAIDSYRFAEVLAPQIPPNERKTSLERVASLADQLVSALDTLGPFERTTMHQALSAGGKGGISRAGHFLRLITKISARVAAEIEPTAGRPLTRKAYIVRDVARELKRCGIAIDASSKGPLVFIVSELFSLLDDPPKDIRSLVRNTLAKIDPASMDFRQNILR